MKVARRDFLFVLAGLLATRVPTPMSATAAEAAVNPSGAVAYMKTVADDLMAAQRVGTVPSFQKAILRHADVEGLAMYSLGPYKGDLQPSQKPSYFTGVSLFMARYFADSSRQYQVGKAEIGDATVDDTGAALVNTRITLMSGSTYNVIFKVTQNGKEYQIADVSVLGFSLATMQRGIFLRFIAKHGGDAQELFKALAR